MGVWATINPAAGWTIHLAASDGALTHLELGRELAAGERIDCSDHPVLREAASQLKAYFAGELRSFDLPLNLRGTPFQQRVWSELLRIPFGETRSYGEMARAIGNPNASRAVGAANGRNPVAIVVPCHRVIGFDGGLCGFGGGLHYKRRLLDLERDAVNPPLFLRSAAGAG